MKGREGSSFPTVSSGTDITLLDKITNIKVFPNICSVNYIVSKVNPNCSYGLSHKVERAGVISFILQTRKSRLKVMKQLAQRCNIN